MKNKGGSFYFECFKSLASHALECAALLRETGSDCDALVRKADRIKTTALKKRCEVIEALRDEFLPPIERRDAAELAFSLYCLEEELAHALRAVCACGGAIGYEKIISDLYFVTKILCDAVDGLQGIQKGKGAPMVAAQADSIDTQVRKLLYDAEKQLYSGQRDTKKLLCNAEICSALSSCIRQCGLTRDMIDTVIINNS